MVEDWLFATKFGFFRPVGGKNYNVQTVVTEEELSVRFLTLQLEKELPSLSNGLFHRDRAAPDGARQDIKQSLIEVEAP